VTDRNCRQPVAPSIAAASYTSRGMAASPPMKSRKVKPNCCHTYTNSTTAAAAPAELNQGTAGMPTRESSQLTTPNCSLNR
jgi:hypothetical protein